MATVSSDPIELTRDEMNRLRGKLFEQVESWGRPRKQEQAMKNLVRRLTYEAQANLESVLRGQGGRH